MRAIFGKIILVCTDHPISDEMIQGTGLRSQSLQIQARFAHVHPLDVTFLQYL